MVLFIVLCLSIKANAKSAEVRATAVYRLVEAESKLELIDTAMKSDGLMVKSEFDNIYRGR